MEPINWEFTLAVVVVGLVVVFVLLLALVGLCTFTGWIFKVIEKKKMDKTNGNDSTKKEAAPKSQAISPVIKAVAAPAVEKGITGDVVAAISAALACIMGTDTKFAVRSIKRTRNTRTAWNSAGIAENTQPF